MLDHVLCARARAGVRLDEGRDRLAEGLVGHADHRGVGDVRMRDERLLDFLRVDVEAAAQHHVLLAIDDSIVAERVGAREVAGAEPPVLQARVPGPVEVAAEHRGSPRDPGAHQQFADFARRHVAPGLVDEPDFDPRNRPADRLGMGELLGMGEARDLRLGESEEREDLRLRQQRDDLALQRDGERLGGDDQPAQRIAAVRVLADVRQQHSNDRGNEARDGDALALDQLERMHRVEFLHHDQRSAQAQRVEHPRAAGAVRERRGHKETVVAVQSPLDRVHVHALNEHVRVGDDRALGPPRGARCVQDHAVVGGIARAERKRWQSGRRAGEDLGERDFACLRLAEHERAALRQPGLGDDLAQPNGIGGERGAAVARDMRDLGGGKPRRSGHRDRAQGEGGVGELDELDAVGQVEQHPVPRPHAEPVQPAGGAPHRVLQRRVTHALRPAHQGGVVGAALGVAGEDGLESHDR